MTFHLNTLEINRIKIGTNTPSFTLNLQKIHTSVEVNFGYCVTSKEFTRKLNL